MVRTREVFEPILMTSFPLSEATEVFMLPQKWRKGRDIPVRMTVLIEFPATADLRAAKVETRTVVPPAPPVVLCVNYNVKI